MPKVAIQPHDRVPHHILLPGHLAIRLRELTKEPGSSMTQIMIDALTVFLDRGAANELDARYAVRFDRLTRAVERLQRHAVFHTEALGTFVQHQLTLVAHHPPFDEETSNLGYQRYDAYLDLVARRIARASRRPDASPADVTAPKVNEDTQPASDEPRPDGEV